MKTTPHLLLAAALALGTSFASALEESKPKPPSSSDAPDATPTRPERDRERDDDDRRERRNERSEEREHADRKRGDDDHDNPRGKQGGRDNDRDEHRRRPDQGVAEQKPVSYIGVMTMPPPPVLSAQLGLPAGFGLVVAEVSAGSPAATAGLQKFDVLTKFNDQQLVDGGQFSTLVRAQAKDTAATLTLFRNGQEQTVTVKIGERMMPEPRPRSSMGGHPFGGNPAQGPFAEQMERMQKSARELGEKMREAHSQGRAPALEQMKKMQERMQTEMRELQERMKERMRQSKPDDADPS